MSTNLVSRLTQAEENVAGVEMFIPGDVSTARLLIKPVRLVGNKDISRKCVGPRTRLQEEPLLSL